MTYFLTFEEHYSKFENIQDSETQKQRLGHNFHQSSCSLKAQLQGLKRCQPRPSSEIMRQDRCVEN